MHLHDCVPWKWVGMVWHLVNWCAVPSITLPFPFLSISLLPSHSYVFLSPTSPPSPSLSFPPSPSLPFPPSPSLPLPLLPSFSLSFPPTPSSHENQVRHYHIKQDEVQKYYISEKHRFATIKDLIDYHKLNGGGTCAHHVTEKLGPGTRPFTGRRKGLGMHLHTSCSHAGMLTWPMKIVDCT